MRPLVIWLCRNCHDDLEWLIPHHQRKDRGFYFRVILAFLEIDCPIELTPEQRVLEILPTLRQLNDQEQFEMVTPSAQLWEEIFFANQE
ncbi:MAG: hypothetical protein COV08_02615 [Candidatus Vogelbacteria bacterium CG10_big_fil_rev_8_21_14_0_10_49_38]|uniref:Uncharacterized protein n=1 Tax=Candidatus Vogelbacteria bacterium CG10_big_fil_rev_8_21_14_0_10_49_38 TaxID=1975043 RepID=A0A2H0RH70_9BACT|nr:MAG: hypothetical protein BK006_02630 [bacterium CG10_49_38]PIR45901.1 MAG: hypothetical protein COV08_02615 [Candidatus Vogelbacteria bacterium CG10_big_fil_rev_8_21_14_0_10_49_38]